MKPSPEHSEPPPLPGDAYEFIEDANGEPGLLLYPPDNARALRWMAALSAQEISYRLQGDPSRWVIEVNSVYAERALHEIRTYEDVNRDWPPVDTRRPADVSTAPADPDSALFTSGITIGALALWFFYTGPAQEAPMLVQRAAADAAGIRSGQWYRCITALTLHSDFTHLFGNLLSLMFFGYVTCRRAGAGLGWLYILLAGGLGNLVNSLLLPGPHISLGASTAGFAALGLAACYQFRDKYVEHPDLRTVWHRAWVAAVAAVAILALLGTGEGTDITGHLAGFVCGGLVGLAGLSLERFRKNTCINGLAYGIAWILLLGAWQLVRHSG